MIKIIFAAAIGAALIATPAKAQSRAVESAPVYVARLTFDVCAAALEQGPNGLTQIVEHAVGERGLAITGAGPLSSLPGDMGVRFARILGAQGDTPVRVFGPPTQMADGFIVSVVREDAQSCAVVVQGGAEALDIVRARLVHNSQQWEMDSTQNGATLYRRIGEGRIGRIRMILAPRRAIGGVDQIIFFQEQAPATTGPTQ
ncbi:MAG: hypothetical protein GC206_13560 [Alphaproteobacteria bacterium]|nr:hypothetical protein [Alphaproteobacteria bacterium]